MGIHRQLVRGSASVIQFMDRIQVIWNIHKIVQGRIRKSKKSRYAPER
jgi:hypothetical protein